MDKYLNREFDKTNALVQALDNTGVCVFMYYPQTKVITVPEKVCEAYHCKAVYENMPYSFAEDFVYEDDHEAFNEMYFIIDNGVKTATAIFHSQDLNFCHHVTLTTVGWTEDGKPEEAIGIIENISDAYKNENIINQLKKELANHNMDDEMDDALKTIATSIGSQYFAVYYICLESRTYVCFQEQLKGVLSLIGERGAYESAWDKYITGYIEEEDQKGLREFIEINTLADRIGRKNTITHVYRRKEIGWTRGQFIVGKRDENGKPLTLIYTVSDINEEIETKLQKQEAEQEALRDPLTKLWNRKAFEQFKESKNYKNNQSGLLLFDIDRFKGINDQYGHDVGDQVIITIANEMRDILRQMDHVFRMGGDEFAVLLYNCNASIWNRVCRKIESLHVNVKAALPSELNVTISAGLCVNVSGYCDKMYKLADQAMYNTKANGRGGCSFINLEGKIINEWHDQSGFLRKGDVLERNSTVTWKIEWPKNEKMPIQIYGDNLFMDFFGIENTATPEETARKWFAGIDSEYLDIIKEAVKATLIDGKSEVIYFWNHQKKGKIQIRSATSFDYETADYYVLIGYLNVLTGLKVFTLENTGNKIRNALEEMYLSNYFIRLSDYSFEAYKIQPYMKEIAESYTSAAEAIDAYVKYMVADESKELMAEFLNLTTIKQRMKNTNYIGVTYHDPNIGEARAKFVVVDRDKDGDVETVSFVVEAI